MKRLRSIRTISAVSAMSLVLLAWGDSPALAAESCTETLDFSSGTFDGWNLSGVGEAEPTISEEHAQSGKSAHFLLTGSQERSELILGGDGGYEFKATEVENGDRRVFSWHTYIPEGEMDYGGPGDHNIIWQLHGGETGVSTDLALELAEYPSGENQRGLYLAAFDEAGNWGNYFLSPISEGAMHKITVAFTASNAKAGAYAIYLDGVLLAEASNVNTIMGVEPWAYIKLGLYRGDDLEGTSALFNSQVEYTEVCAPGVTTDAATGIVKNGATLNSTVNPNGAATTYRFEYGKTAAYGTSVPVPDGSVGSGVADVAKSAVISGLSPETTYHYRVVAENSEGTSYGEDRTFTTLAAAASELLSFGGFGEGNGEFLWSLGMASDAAGNLWVVDYYAKIQKFNSNGEYLGKFGSGGSGNGQFSIPIGIAITSTGDLWIVDSGNNRVQKFNSSGEYLGKFGSAGSGNGQFNSPWGIAIAPNGHLWISDEGNDRIQEFTANGEFIREVHGAGYGGSGNGELSNPRGIATDASGNVWVADFGNHRVQKFSPSGEFLGKFGTKGTGNGQFDEPIGVAVKAGGNLFVIDRNRVQQMSPSGEYLGQLKWMSWPNFMTFGPEGTFWVGEAGSRRVSKWHQP